MRIPHLSCGAVALLAACSTVDTVDSRAESMNQSAAAYANTATLLNIVRASQYEPLSFVSVTGITGHNTLTGTLGLPNGTFGPNQTATQRLFIFGPNSVGGTASNDFNVSVIDDPGSYQALLTPINPAVIGFFISQGYPRELLFYLFVDRLWIERTPGHWYEYDNHPVSAAEAGTDAATSFMEFYGQMGTLLQEGLTVEVDKSAFPAARIVPPFQICFDPNLPFFAYAADNGKQPENRSSGALAGGDYAAIKPGTCEIGSNWVLPADSPDKKGKDKGAAGHSAAPPSAAWEFKNGQGRRVRIYTRSVYGVYQFLGQIVADRLQLDVLRHTDPADRALITMHQAGFRESCFARASYGTKDWCVPETANNTKRIFGLLHQMVGLNTTPSNQANTATVRTTP